MQPPRMFCVDCVIDISLLVEPWCLYDPDDRLWSTLGLSLVAQNDKALPSICVFKTSNIVNFKVVVSHP